MINFDYHINIANKSKTRTILTCNVLLDRDTMLDALKAKAILINGKHYHVPERKLLNCLLHYQFGEIELDLELIEE